jgi:putative ABC transport system permease protein
MNTLRQSLVVSRISLAGLPRRLWPSLVIVVGAACVIGVLLAMLSVTAGVVRAYRSGDDPRRALVHGKSSSGGQDGLSRAAVATILNAPGIARDSAGKPLADAEVHVQLPPVTGFAAGSLQLYGIGPAGIAIRSELRFVAGRMYQRGLHEVIIGNAAHRLFGLSIGDFVIMPDGKWPIVGIFSAAGGILESELLADGETLMSTTGTNSFDSMLVQLENPAAFDALRSWLTTNPTLSVGVETQADYYARSVASLTRFFSFMAVVVGAMLAVGALFGAINIMYGAVSTRTREIATLRAIGYESLPIAISVVFESVVLSLLGAMLGTGIAWLISNGKLNSIGSAVFENSVSPRLVAIGFAWALALALFGSLFPAIRAGKLEIAEAARAT